MIYGRYFGLSRKELGPRADELLEFVELTERAGDKVEPLSGGMKRRLTIARSLINEPEVLLLDEPTTGLDPQARHVVWDRLYRLKRQGVTLLLTTHYMDEAEQLCDRLVVMDKGKIVAEGSPRELIERYSTREVVELRFDDYPARRPELLDRRARQQRRDPARPRPPLHGRRRRGIPRDARARARPGERPRSPEHARGRLPAPDRPEPHRMTNAHLRLACMGETMFPPVQYPLLPESVGTLPVSHAPPRSLAGTGHDSPRSSLARTSSSSPSTGASGAPRSSRASSRPSSTCWRSASAWARSSETSPSAARRTTTSSSSRPVSSPRRPCSSRRSRRAGPCCPRSSGPASTTRCSRRRSESATSRFAHQAFIALAHAHDLGRVLRRHRGVRGGEVAARRPGDPGRRARRALATRRSSPRGPRTRRTRPRSSRSSGS